MGTTRGVGWAGAARCRGAGKARGTSRTTLAPCPIRARAVLSFSHSARLNLALNVRLVAERPRNPRVSRETESEALGLR